MLIYGHDPEDSVFIIAEVGANHNMSLDRAKELLEAAYDSGADAYKLQFYRADTLYSQYSTPAEWSLIKSLEVPVEWLKELSVMAHARKMAFICSVFCCETAYFANLYCDALKIASSDWNHYGLLAYVSELGNNVLVSVGMSSWEQEGNINVLLGGSKHALMACNAVYPTHFADLPFSRVKELATHGMAGFSDHSLSETAASFAVACGARIIEKHFTMSRDDEGPDHAHSVTPEEFSNMVANVRLIEHALSKPAYGVSVSERDNNSTFYQRSCHAARDIPAGKLLDVGDIIIQRPNDGEEPLLWGMFLDKVAGRNIQKGEPLCLSSSRGLW
jgi:sialic acid synthase SpsE